MKTKVVHSQTKSAWNIINTIPGQKYKIARIPYNCVIDENRTESYKMAVWLSEKLNNEWENT